jgi:TetR/AcrR family transcriptional regulator
MPWGVDMKTARRNAEKTKTRVLQTAERIFVQRGYAGTKVDQIAQEAGVNKLMIYACFGDKENLYREVLKKTYREFH